MDSWIDEVHFQSSRTIVFLGMTGALAPFSYLVTKILNYCPKRFIASAPDLVMASLVGSSNAGC
jgi:hypothetical protein